HAPTSANQVVLDQHTVDDQHFAVGDTVKVVTRDGVEAETLVGVVKFGDSASLAGAVLVAFDTPTAQHLLGLTGQFNTISITAKKGVSDETLAAAISAKVGKSYDVRTGAQTQSDDKKAFGFVGNVRWFLLIFALISLVVGAFVIANTFQVLVTQRIRELALLRALGASQRQVLRSVVAEGATVGLIGAVLGVAAGLGIATGLMKVFPGGSDSGPLVIRGWTFLWGLLTGVVMAVLASVLPAYQAGRVPPVAAMRDADALPRKRSLRQRTSFGLGLLVAGIVGLVIGLNGSGTTALIGVGVGALLILLTVATLSPLFSSQVLNLLGAWLPRAAGTVGRLARENAVRNPRRSSATAAALMIGMAVVAAFTVLGASASTSFGAVVHKSLKAQVVVYPENQGSDTGVPIALVPEATRIPKVGSATAIQSVRGRIDDKKGDLTVVQPNWLDAVNVRKDTGDITLQKGDVLVDTTKASDKHWGVGTKLTLLTARSGTQTVTVSGTYKPNQLLGDYVIGADTVAADSTVAPVDVILLSGTPGTTPDQLASSIKTALTQVPGLKVETQAEFLKSVQKQIDQVLQFITILLAFAFIIAYLGVINTLVLSVVERTREIGLLRAVGLTRKQLKWTLRWESVLISAYGGVLGIVVGGVLGAALVHALKDQGITDLSLAPGRLIFYFVLASVLGLVAAGIPGRRAAKMKPLEAIATV
ncbi:MAG TPA: FtsX-like permease family protein, partial [Mycobacteriales bacterium]|nr:FtsX-like permease family protein [Mycobacteriales bacterium]